MKKKIVYATMIMSTIALLSTGFAAWVISGSSTETQTGNIAVDTVSNVSRILSDFKWGATVNDDEGANPTNPYVVFDRPEDLSQISVNDPWLKNDDTVEGSIEKFENLTLTATFTVSNVGAEETLNKIFSSIAITSVVEEGQDDIYDNCEDAGLVTPLPRLVDADDATTWSKYVIDVENGTTSSTDGSTNGAYGITIEQTGIVDGNANYTLTVKFNWGKIFDYTNPYIFYNTHDMTDNVPGTDLTYAEHAEQHLTALNALNGSKFKLTIVTKMPE